ncbi:MAG: alpha/beta hydrolase [Flavobacteriales bacterium]|nr:alpha/beta hydrolase [Flavobacteriales bacterium]
MAQPHIFFISGLGADHRAFDRIKLDGYQQTHLPWIIPEWKDTMSSYAKKLAEPILKAKNPVVIGLSLGGMLASEMTTFIPHLHVILISSIKSPEERSTILKLGRAFPIQGLMPPNTMKKFTFIWDMLQKKKLKGDSKHMIQMFRDQNDKFLRWAILHAPKWKGKGDEKRIAHIHGTADRMFPAHRIKNFIPVYGGTHLMVYVKGDEVTQLIKKELKRIEDVL